MAVNYLHYVVSVWCGVGACLVYITQCCRDKLTCMWLMKALSWYKSRINNVVGRHIAGKSACRSTSKSGQMEVQYFKLGLSSLVGTLTVIGRPLSLVRWLCHWCTKRVLLTLYSPLVQQELFVQLEERHWMPG